MNIPIPMNSWKTTTLGIFIGAMYIAANYYQPGMSWKTWATGAGIAVFGAIAKDFNVTGGTTPATAEAVARTSPAATLPPSVMAPALPGTTGTIIAQQVPSAAEIAAAQLLKTQDDQKAKRVADAQQKVDAAQAELLKAKGE
jgi:hypothetical protein